MSLDLFLCSRFNICLVEMNRGEINLKCIDLIGKWAEISEHVL